MDREKGRGIYYDPADGRSFFPSYLSRPVVRSRTKVSGNARFLCFRRRRSRPERVACITISESRVVNRSTEIELEFWSIGYIGKFEESVEHFEVQTIGFRITNICLCTASLAHVEA